MKKFWIVLLALIMAVSFAACGENSDTPGGDEPGTNTEENGDGDFKFDIREDDHTVIITVANTKQVYTHDGVNVTGYTTYADCGDHETAKAVASTINPKDSYYEGMGLKSVTVKGSYVIQEYTEAGFPCKTYEELQRMAEMYQQIR